MLNMRRIRPDMLRQISWASGIIKDMNARLIGYLRDNRDQIIENWLTEVDVPASEAAYETKHDEGIVPYAFFSEAFEAVIQVLESGDCEAARLGSPQLKNFIGQSCDCRRGQLSGRVCLELQDAGLNAFTGVLSQEWDTTNEFSPSDRGEFVDLIHHALSGFFGHEVDNCPRRSVRPDCPFTAYLPSHP